MNTASERREENIVYQGKIFEVVQQKIKTDNKEQVFEFARRSPGVRLIIPTTDGSILLTKELRSEHDGVDYRLPGGKVFDALVEYNEFLKSGEDITHQAKNAAIKEAREEVGIEVKELSHFATSKAGATVVWDLFYFVVDSYVELGGQALEHGEEIEVSKVSLDEAKEICLDGRMREERSAAVLLRFLHKK